MSEEKRERIRYALRAGVMTSVEIALEFGCSDRTVYRIKRDMLNPRPRKRSAGWKGKTCGICGRFASHFYALGEDDGSTTYADERCLTPAEREQFNLPKLEK